MKRIPPFMYLLIALAGIGLTSSLLRNPSQFILSIFIMVVIAFVVYFIITSVRNRQQFGRSSDEMKKYQRAVKQSKQKYHKQSEPLKRQKQTKNGLKNRTSKGSRHRKRRRISHLTVIDGKKTSQKGKDDRASN